MNQAGGGLPLRVNLMGNFELKQNMRQGDHLMWARDISDWKCVIRVHYIMSRCLMVVSNTLTLLLNVHANDCPHYSRKFSIVSYLRMAKWSQAQRKYDPELDDTLAPLKCSVIHEDPYLTAVISSMASGSGLVL